MDILVDTLIENIYWIHRNFRSNFAFMFKIKPVRTRTVYKINMVNLSQGRSTATIAYPYLRHDWLFTFFD